MRVSFMLVCFYVFVSNALICSFSRISLTRTSLEAANELRVKVIAKGFVPSFERSFIRSFIRSFVCSFLWHNYAQKSWNLQLNGA